MAKPAILAVDDDAAVVAAVVRDLRERYGAGLPGPAGHVGRRRRSRSSPSRCCGTGRWPPSSPTSGCRG